MKTKIFAVSLALLLVMAMIAPNSIATAAKPNSSENPNRNDHQGQSDPSKESKNEQAETANDAALDNQQNTQEQQAPQEQSAAQEQPTTQDLNQELDKTVSSSEAIPPVNPDVSDSSCISDLSNSKAELAKSAKEATLNLLQQNAQYQHAAQNLKQQALDQMVCLAENRQQTLISLIKNFDDTSVALTVSFSKDIKAGFPQEVQPYIEEEKVVSGTLDVIHSDDFILNISKFYYFLNSADGSQIELYFNDQKPIILSDSQVVARGIAISDNILAISKDQSSFEVTSTPVALEAASMTMKKVAVILFNWQNNPVQPYTKDTAKSVTFTGAGSVNSYYQEISFNKVGFTGHLSPDGDVFGWYTVPYDSTNCPYSSGSSAAKSIAAADGFNAANYDKIVFAFPSTANCPGWGWAGIGGKESWVQGSYALRVVGHELGHNFGVHHANSYRCTDAAGIPVVISSTCASSEYGDPFDIMGSSTNHMNNFQKGRLSYYDLYNTASVITDGTYTIDAIEKSSGGVQALRIPKDYDSFGNVLKYYYLEYRQPFGFDNFASTSQVVNGISIRIAPPYTTVTQTQLLDSTPGTSSFSDATFLPGTLFEDPIKGIIVKPVSRTADTATVTIQFGPGICVRSSPTVSISPSTQWGYPGDSLTYTLSVTNNDSSACSPSTFTINPTLPLDWSQTPLAPTLTLSGGASSTVQVGIKSAVDATIGPYSVSETATNNSDSAYKTTSSATYDVRLPDTTPPVVSISSPKDGAAIPNKGTMKVAASASDSESGIAKIQISIDGSVKKTCNNTSSCQYNWQVSGISLGSHVITATATDKAPAANINSASVTVKK